MDRVHVLFQTPICKLTSGRFFGDTLKAEMTCEMSHGVLFILLCSGELCSQHYWFRLLRGQEGVQ